MVGADHEAQFEIEIGLVVGSEVALGPGAEVGHGIGTEAGPVAEVGVVSGDEDGAVAAPVHSEGAVETAELPAADKGSTVERPADKDHIQDTVGSTADIDTTALELEQQ